MIVRGRVDHMDGGKVCVIVSEATLFEPSEREIEQAKEQAAEQAERSRRRSSCRSTPRACRRP